MVTTITSAAKSSNPLTKARTSNLFSYDAASRLQTVSDGVGNSATYFYLANSPLVSQISFTA